METTEIATVVETAVVETAVVESVETEMGETEMEQAEQTETTEVVETHSNADANKKIKFANQCRSVLFGLELIRFVETRNNLKTDDATDFVAEVFASTNDEPKAELIEAARAAKEAHKAAAKAAQAARSKTRGKPLSPEMTQIMKELGTFVQYVTAVETNNAPLRAALVAAARAQLNLRKLAPTAE